MSNKVLFPRIVLCLKMSFWERYGLLDSTFFSFGNKIYKQNFGSHGLSFITCNSEPNNEKIRDGVLDVVEFGYFVLLQICWWYCIVVFPSKIDILLQQFNLFHPRLQFTTEIGGDKINFLDIIISINRNRFIFDWYRKPTFSGKFLNFNSNYPIAQKEIQFFC